MFDLISLLAQQSAKQVEPSPNQPSQTAPIIQSNSQTPSLAPVPSVAIPEAVSVESPTPAPTSTLPENSQPPRSTVTIAPTPTPESQTPEQTTLPPEENRASAATSRMTLPPVNPLASPSPAPPVATKPLTKPSAKEPSTQAVQSNSLQKKAAPNQIPKTAVRADALEKNQIENDASSLPIDAQQNTKDTVRAKTATPQLFQPRNQPTQGIVEPTQSEQPSNKDAQPPRLSESPSPKPDRELVFEVPKLPPLPTAKPSPAPQAAASNHVKPTILTPQARESEPPKLAPDNDVKAPTAPTSRIEQQQKLLEQRLAEIVAKERAEKQAQQQVLQQDQQDNLVNQAYSYATQRRFDRARQIAQNPRISAEVRTQILSQVNDLERASRSLGVTNLAEPTPAKPLANSTNPKPSTVASQPRLIQRLPQSIAQLPRSVQSLPNTPLRPQQSVIRNAPSTLDTDSPDPGSVVNPQNLPPLNRTVPSQELSKDQLLYPLPEPVPVTSRFGWRVHPVTRARRFHAGVDLGAAQGTPVLASRGGRVTVADRLGGYGLAVVMQHNDGTQDTLYAHLSQIFVRPGERIQPGTVIGRVGSTGLSTGPHLHYEARRKSNTGWVAVDPGAQIESARMRLVQSRQNARVTPAGES